MLAVTAPPPADTPPLTLAFVQRPPRRPRAAVRAEMQMRVVIAPPIVLPTKSAMREAPQPRIPAVRTIHMPQPQYVQAPPVAPQPPIILTRPQKAVKRHRYLYRTVRAYVGPSQPQPAPTPPLIQARPQKAAKRHRYLYRTVHPYIRVAQAAPPPTPPLIQPQVHQAKMRRFAGRMVRTILPQMFQVPPAPPPAPPRPAMRATRPRRTRIGAFVASHARVAQPQATATPARVFVQRPAPEPRRRRRLLRRIFLRGIFAPAPPTGPAAPTTRETFAPGTSGRSKASGDDGRVGFGE